MAAKAKRRRDPSELHDVMLALNEAKTAHWFSWKAQTGDLRTPFPAMTKSGFHERLANAAGTPTRPRHTTSAGDHMPPPWAGRAEWARRERDQPTPYALVAEQ